jgi:succinate dehydrogenase / fumarate reductase cytochrome b subunit
MANTNTRPTSPHLQIYQLPLTGMISISHRISGVLLCFGLVLFACLLSSLANGPEHFLAAQQLLRYPLILWLYRGFVFALCFHLCHGFRHLLWDAGYSFEHETMNRYAWLEVAASLLLTPLVLIFF